LGYFVEGTSIAQGIKDHVAISALKYPSALCSNTPLNRFNLANKKGPGKIPSPFPITYRAG
jgi:hypothetical protein